MAAKKPAAPETKTPAKKAAAPKPKAPAKQPAAPETKTPAKKPAGGSALKAKLAAHKQNSQPQKPITVEALIGASDVPESEEVQKLRVRVQELEKENENIRLMNAAFDQQGKGAEAGRPIMVPIEDVIENPDRPNTRTEVDPEFEAWLESSIKETGIQDPISCHWSEKYGKWIINKGHTRRKIGERAGLTQVPIIIQDDQTEWNQVIENLIRNKLPTGDTVKFIAAKLAEGHKQKEIGKRLGRDAGWVSKHVALIDPPAFIKHIWEQGYADKFTTLHSLLTSYKVEPQITEAEVNKILAKKKSISLDEADAIKVKIAGKDGKGKDKNPGDLQPPDDNTGNSKEPGTSSNSNGKDEGGDDENNGTTREPQKQLRLKVVFDDTEGFVVIERASSKNLVKIQLKTGAFAEVPAEDLKIIGVVLG